ncbi:hypothetical protein BUE80_DR006426 [Diplocarpon rosae]|nr:hypothetical protein BUE80_DR006426 [Diplocarpon rosae]
MTTSFPSAVAPNDTPEPFPSLSDHASPTTARRASTDNQQSRTRDESSTSTIQSRLRGASKNFQESSPPAGFMIASSQIASAIPTLSDIRKAGINRGWFRLAGSQELPVTLGPAEIDNELPNVAESSIPFPISKVPDAPLTGFRAPPTALWKLDFVIWTMVWNTFLQAVLSGFMWGLNRYDRPSWSTGLFVALACIVAACGGIMSFIEGKHVKAIEGVPVSEADQGRLRRDRELGIVHYNNIKDERPKEKKARVERRGLFKRKQMGQDKI